MVRASCWFLAVSILLAGGGIALTGCKSTGYDRTSGTVSTMEQIVKDLNAGKQQIDKTVASLKRVVETADTDPRPAFQEFSKDVTTVESIASRVRGRAESMRKQTDAHYAAWEKELTKMSSEDLRDRSQERMDLMKKEFAKIDEAFQKTSEAYDPFIADLKDVRLYLEQDLNPTGIKSASDVIKKTEKDATTLESRVDKAISVIEEVKKKVAPLQQAPPAESE
jgi:hypothetical protein